MCPIIAERLQMSNETIWDANSLAPKVVQILRDLKYDGHHLGRPFVTSYQLAILFKETFREDFDRLGYLVGGKGIGREFTLASYLARELSQRIKRDEIANERNRRSRSKTLLLVAKQQ